jgi:hypothetical protein
MNARAERVAIVGSRDFANLDVVRACVAQLPPGTVVVSGGSRGVERAAEEAATTRGLLVERVRPEANMSGPERYAIRNELLVAAAERMIAFWDGVSAGTADAIARARAAGKAVDVRRG